MEDAGSEKDVSCDVERVSDVLDGTEEDVSCDVEGMEADVWNEEDMAVESETLSKVGVDVDGSSAGGEDTGESFSLPVAASEFVGSCPEIADSSP